LLLPSLFPALYHYNLLEKISETSPVKVRTLSLHLSAIYTPCDYCSYWTSTSFAVLSSHVASYMISVRQTRGLPKASFRFHITMDTLAIGYALTATRSRSGLTPVRVRPCWANKKTCFTLDARNRFSYELPKINLVIKDHMDLLTFL